MNRITYSNRSAIAEQLVTILKHNAPVDTGNLRLRGVYSEYDGNNINVIVGGSEAPYAPYTETRSFKKGWQKKSNEEFLNTMRKYGAKIT